MLQEKTVFDLSYVEAVEKIVDLQEHINSFWSEADGWAPIEAANLLTKSRLDWLLSLSKSLFRWEEDLFSDQEEGDLILAWVNLGTLVEGTMKFFLSVYYQTYIEGINHMISRKKVVDPDGAMFNQLREFFKENIWSASEVNDKNNWLLYIQEKRNAIHAYKDRDIENFSVFNEKVKEYLQFLIDILKRVPYPDDIYGPDLFLGYK